MIESKIQKKVLQYLETNKIYNYKVISANKRGVLDITVCYEGRFIAIEVKTEKGKTTPLQDKHIQEIQANKGYAFVAHSFEEFKKQFERITSEILPK
jgi:penicillin-binding protein-related factor A (putative recombinase)